MREKRRLRNTTFGGKGYADVGKEDIVRKRCVIVFGLLLVAAFSIAAEQSVQPGGPPGGQAQPGVAGGQAARPSRPAGEYAGAPSRGGHPDQEWVTDGEIIVLEQPPLLPVVDVHAHFAADEQYYELAAKSMDLAGIAATVALTGSTGEQLDRHLEIAAKYPGRFLIFCGVRAAREDMASDKIGEIYAAQLQEAHDKGAAGFGEIVRWAMRGGERGGISWDDPRLDAMWAKLEELKMPVNWHVADPSRYWRPESPLNTLEGRSYYRSAPLKYELLMQQNRVLEKHPNLVVIAAHSNYLADMIPLLEWRFRTYPNYYCDLSATMGEWGRVPEEFKYMATEYADRFFYGTDAGYRGSVADLFGGDMDLTAKNLAAFQLSHIMFLGTSQRMLPIPFNGNYGRYFIGWKTDYTRYAHDGVKLPDDVLRKICYENAERLFGIKVADWKPPKPPFWVKTESE